MIKFKEIHPIITSEEVEADGYVFAVSWNNNAGPHWWWMVEHNQRNILEIAMNTMDVFFINHICLVTIQSDWVTVHNQPYVLDLSIPAERGLPICEWDKTNRYGGDLFYFHEQIEIRRRIGPQDAAIHILPERPLVRLVMTDCVRFGFDAEDHLALIHVVNLSTEQIKDIKWMCVDKYNSPPYKK